MSEDNLQRTILMLLAKAVEPLNCVQVQAACEGASSKAVNSRLSNLIRDGAALRHHNPTGILSYTFNPAWRPKRDKALAEALKLDVQAKAKKPLVGFCKPKPAPVATPAAAPVKPPAPAKAIAPSAAVAPAAKTPAPVVAESPAVKTPAPPVAAPSFSSRIPCGLLDRCEAVSTDIEDLLGDACDARIDHDTIKALVVAQGAIQRAARALQA